MKNRQKTQKIVTLSILLSISIVLSIVEGAITFGIPGAKLGLANIITLVVMYLYSEKDAFTVVILRILLVGLVRTLGSPAFFLSLAGGLLAFLMMFVFKKTNRFSLISVSVMGSLGHSVGQIVMAIFILDTPQLIWYFPFIFLIAIPTGIFVGLTSQKFISVSSGIMAQK